MGKLWKLRISLTALVVVAVLSLGSGTCRKGVDFQIVAPLLDQLSLAGEVPVELSLPDEMVPGSLVVTLDGVDMSGEFVESPGVAAGGSAEAMLPVGNGIHTLIATVGLDGGGAASRATVFQTVALENPDGCDILVGAECLLPYPSSRFLEPAATATGVQVAFPAAAMPEIFDFNIGGTRNISAEPFNGLDGFSPTVQILMHFPGNVDLGLSDASRLTKPSRSYGTRSLEADSPSVLLDLDTGERILHFLERDAFAPEGPDPSRELVFLRPGRSLVPGHRYAVAVRGLVHGDGSPVEPEAPFAVLRDDRPSTIPALEARRDSYESVIFPALAQAGIAREDLILAFDFTVRSDEQLTGAMLSMRDQAFDWLAQQDQETAPTFTVKRVNEFDCNAGPTARIVEGNFQVPLFLTSDPVENPPVVGFLNVDESGVPVQAGVTNPEFTIAIPCTAVDGSGTRVHPLVIGHGLFGEGRSFIGDIGEATDVVVQQGLPGFDYIGGATDWLGLSVNDFGLIISVLQEIDDFRALPDRLRQGQLDTLVLARMMDRGVFNVHPAFRDASDVGVFPGEAEESFYFGASLGGIMGLMFAALSPDVERAYADVAAINFSLLVPRSQAGEIFLPVFELLNADPLAQSLIFQLLHEVWVTGESAGYATHITSNPLPDTNAKPVVITMAMFDHLVSNQASEIAARTLGLSNLRDTTFDAGSAVVDLAEIPDAAGPLGSAFIAYDLGSFDPTDPRYDEFIPPLANQPVANSRCDPHGKRAFVPASLEQMLRFLKPAGDIVNFCSGVCDGRNANTGAFLPYELEKGRAQPCNPL